jgi:transposase
MGKLGYDARLIAPQYVCPFVKRQKNDAADAEAIVTAAQRPEMRFVKLKSEELIAQRTCDVRPSVPRLRGSTAGTFPTHSPPRLGA